MSDSAARSDSGGDGPGGRAGVRDALRRLPDAPDVPATRGVLLVTALALAIRLVGLGERIFHWDEGRVGYWILRFDATGEFFYRPIIHGPFLPVVNNALFDVLPASDFTARLPVAVAGGLLPLAALCFRDRLRGREQVALALVLAVDPLLVYYGRFMRSDVLVGAFSFGAFALAVYAIDRRRTLALLPAAGLLALGFASKENALVYLACFLGAGVVLADHYLARAAARTGSPLAALVGGAVALAGFADEWTAGARTRRYLEREREFGPGAALAVHLAVWVPLVLLGVAVTFLAVVAFFYAPRPELWRALAGTADLTGVLERATLGAAERFYGTWASGRHAGHPYVPYLYDLLETLAYGSGVTVVLAAVGFLVDGYGGRGRAIVAFATYWAVASALGYPIATDIQAPWAAVHVTLPLAIPAAVGAAAVVDSLEASLAAEDAVGVGLAVLIILAGVGGVAAANVDYWNSAAEEDKQVLQWAQPGNPMKSTLRDVRVVARHHEGTDVLFVGTKTPRGGRTQLYVENESSLETMPPGGPSWHSRLPLPWYLERYGATVNSTPPEARFDGLPADMPPVVVAYSWDRDELAARLDGYVAHRHAFRLWGEHVVIFVDESALREARRGESGG